MQPLQWGQNIYPPSISNRRTERIMDTCVHLERALANIDMYIYRASPSITNDYPITWQTLTRTIWPLLLYVLKSAKIDVVQYCTGRSWTALLVWTSPLAITLDVEDIPKSILGDATCPREQLKE
jgi:hypothetical protein